MGQKRHNNGEDTRVSKSLGAEEVAAVVARVVVVVVVVEVVTGFAEMVD